MINRDILLTEDRSRVGAAVRIGEEGKGGQEVLKGGSCPKNKVCGEGGGARASLLPSISIRTFFS